MMLTPPSLVAAGIVAVVLLLTGVRAWLVGYRGHQYEKTRRTDYEDAEDESKLQLLRELEAAAEQPPAADGVVGNLIQFAERDASDTLSGGSSITAHADVGYGVNARPVPSISTYSMSIPTNSLGALHPVNNNDSVRAYVPIPHWQLPWEQHARPKLASQKNPGDGPSLFVNAKQFHRILKRREARQKLEEKLRGIVNGEVSLQKGLRKGAGGQYGSMRRQRGAERRSSEEGVAKEAVNG